MAPDSNTTSNSTLAQNAPAPTDLETWIRLIIFYILFSLISFFGNVMTIFVSYRNEHMRDSRFYVIVRHLCFCRALACLQFLTIGLFHCLRIASRISIDQTIFTCLLIYIWFLHYHLLELFLLTFMTIDRIISIAFPIRYWSLTTKQANRICLLLIILAILIKVTPSFFVRDTKEMIKCTTVFSTGTPWSNFLYQLIDNIMLGLLIFLQLSLMLFVHFRTKIQAKTEAETIFIKRHCDLISILKKQVLFHCGLQILSKTILLSSRLIIDPKISGRLVAYGGMIITVDIFVNTFLLLFGKDDMRRTFLRLLKWNKKDTHFVKLF